MLNEVADGVWVRQSEWVWSNATVIRGEDGLILVDPGIDGSDLSKLADDVDEIGLPVVAGILHASPRDHLLWHSRFGAGPRYATPDAPTSPVKPGSGRRRWRRESASGIPLELIALVTPLPADGDRSRRDPRA